MQKIQAHLAQASMLFLTAILFACGGGGGDSDADTQTADSQVSERVPLDTHFSGRKDIGYDDFGYQSEFDRQYQQLGNLSTTEFSQRYSNGENHYVAGISWDVTTASFWQQLQSNTTVYYQLDQAEVEMIRKNGFVVSERQARNSFADHYYDIFMDDLPVFISSDSVLHAWHRSFDAILMEIEETWIAPIIDTMLQTIAEAIPALWQQNDNSIFKAAIEDVDIFITVARSLLAGEQVPSQLQQDARLNEILSAIALQQNVEFTLFGESRIETFSQYQPRGHYTKSEALQRYFKALMWLGRTDFNLAEAVDGEQADYTLRQLLAAVALSDLLFNAQQFDKLKQVDQFLQLFVGQVDSMTFSQFDTLLRNNGIEKLADLNTMNDVHNLQAALLAGDWGRQAIQARPFSYRQLENFSDLPRSLTFLGQRFTLDAWVTEMTTHDGLDARRDNRRYIPSALDTAFAVLGNSQVTSMLVDRIEHGGTAWRDGIEFQRVLAASREVIDHQSDAAWESSIYNQWLHALRALSEPTTGAQFPEAMRTKAWASKTLDTQLASWTELRHDTILYVKQPSGIGACYYPEGFVEPRIAFWQRLEKLSRSAAQGIATLVTPETDANDPRVNLLQKQTSFLTDFADTVAALGNIADKQLAQQTLTAGERWYLENVVEIVEVYIIPGGLQKQYNGWYPGLFYTGRWDSASNDALIADIHTVVPREDGTYSGHVLNQATGKVKLMAIAIENGDDKVVYLGPVLSHYEFRTDSETRLSDDEWKAMLRDGDTPPLDEWTLDYLVPGN